jgi:uncharacterized protein (AIM24 family)
MSTFSTNFPVNYLYFAESDVQETDDAMMVKSSNFTACDPVSGGIKLYFDKISGGTGRESITLACANGNQKTVLEAFVSILNSGSHGKEFIVVADANVANGQSATFHKAFNGLVTNCTIN